MTTKTAATTLEPVDTGTGIVPILFALALGLGIIAVAGHVQASGLHAAAHDVRHATGFPCH